MLFRWSVEIGYFKINQCDKRHQTSAGPLVIMNTMKLHFAFAPETNGSCGIHEPNCDFATFKVWNLRSYILSCRMSCNTALKRWGTPPSSTESPDKEISRFPGLECASGLHGNSTWTTNLPKTEWANHLSFQKIVPPKIIQSPILVLRTPPVFLFLFFILCKTWPSSSGFQDRLQIQQGVDGG